jgi:hypothetical protein
MVVRVEESRDSREEVRITFAPDCRRRCVTASPTPPVPPIRRAV